VFQHRTGAVGEHVRRPRDGERVEHRVRDESERPLELPRSDGVAEGLAERPESRGEFDFAAYASVSVAADAEAAREAARPPVAFIAGGAPGPVLDRHGIDRERASAVGEAIAAGEFAAAFERVTPAMLEAFCIAGTPGTVADRLGQLLEKADSVVAASPLGPGEEAIDLAARALRRASE